MNSAIAPDNDFFMGPPGITSTDRPLHRPAGRIP
jgi:hypothetical protein